jgi:hypothetical protein
MERSVIHLDGWCIAVRWGDLYWGDSFFVPTTNPRHDRRAIADSAKKAGCEIAMKLVIEDEVRGLRVWVKAAVLY